jgi:glycosyltransferase involved in cell wall biosynthesis
MKLLMITRKVDHDDSVAGFTYQWVRQLADQLEQLYVICLEKGNTRGLPDNCQVFSLGKEKKKNRIKEFFLFHHFARRLVRCVDGVFAHQNPEYGIMISPWTKIFNKKLVAWYTHKSVTIKLRLLNFLADRMLSASRDSFRLASKKLKVLHHGIDVKLFLPEPRVKSLPKKIVSISRLSPIKNIDLMIRLAAGLTKDGLDLTLLVAGDSGIASDKVYQRKLSQIVKDLGINENVKFLGPIANKLTPAIYQRADLFLNFSDTGSLDKSVLEAMSCGTPVLVTNEAFAEILPAISENMFASKDLDELTNKAKKLLSSGAGTVSAEERDYVVKNHNLENLIGEIIRAF